MAMPLLQEINAEISPRVLCSICGQKCVINRVDADFLKAAYTIWVTCAYHGWGETSVTKQTLRSEEDVRLITLYMTPKRFMDVMRNNEMQAKERGVDLSELNKLVGAQIDELSTAYFQDAVGTSTSISMVTPYMPSYEIKSPIKYYSEEKKPKIKPEKPPGKRKIRLNGDK